MSLRLRDSVLVIVLMFVCKWKLYQCTEVSWGSVDVCQLINWHTLLLLDCDLITDFSASDTE